jgi:hypothetical protein
VRSSRPSSSAPWRSLTFAGFVAFAGAVSHGLARTLAEAGINRWG